MTVTETRPQADTVPNPAAGAGTFAAPGLAGVFGTSDHKSLGRLYVLFGLTGGMLALVLNILVRLERIGIDDIDVLTFGSDNQFFQTWSLARTSLLFFCVLPLLIGLATYIVPLQVGAPSIAFPRAAAAAFWAWLIGILIHVVTVFVDGGLGVPEPTTQFAEGTEPEATELSILSIALVVIAVMLATVCIVTTVIAQRPIGMTLLEVPLFSWSMLVAGAVWLLAFPVWLSNLAVAWVDFRGEDALRYGRVSDIWNQLDWLWSQPMVFAFAIPVLGIVGDIVPVAAGVRQRSYGLQQGAIAAFGVLSFGAFAQPYYNPNVSDQGLYVILGLAIALPTVAFLGGLADTLMRGKPAFSGQLVLGLFAMVTLLAGAAVAAFAVSGSAIGVVQEIDSGWLIKVTDWLDDLRGTVIATGVMQLVLCAAVIAAIAGLYHWAPKIFGCRLNVGIGSLVGLTLAGGAVLVGGSNVANGILDESDDVFATGAYAGVWDADAVELVNIIGLVGSFLLAAGVGLVLLDILVSVLFGKGIGEDAADPWNGHTLEWATASPPPHGNFEAAPIVESERPLLDAKEGAGS